MVRGRRKDLTAPPSRALAQQRAYRARKEEAWTHLQERCERLEEENALLRQQLQAVTGHGAPSWTSSAAGISASSALMEHLDRAYEALGQYRQQAMNGAFQSRPGDSRAYGSSGQLLQTPDPLDSSLLTTVSYERGAAFESAQQIRQSSPTSVAESECCGGFIDCTELAPVTSDTSHILPTPSI
ncbi:hypothetical protein SISSUDRAFT_1064054 [Sistotremastrum suecicum HHB10207 ss-3]|uniref:BZIP domain-containing protein n=1 Tax=Sistotremastrum suecicum HHB10207 ss-3 TaxID=1314776 RepID=A0A166B4F1_9AGAM|nr:hypothetical protein SISSUDRAFT_1064054 [Sistotremastrum suecicum HHB10207 ss-3]